MLCVRVRVFLFCLYQNIMESFVCIFSDSDFFFFFKQLCFPGIARVWRFLMEKCSSLFGFSGTHWARGDISGTGSRKGSLRGWGRQSRIEMWEGCQGMGQARLGQRQREKSGWQGRVGSGQRSEGRGQGAGSGDTALRPGAALRRGFVVRAHA